MSASLNSNNVKANGVDAADKNNDDSAPAFWKYHALLPSEVTQAMTKLSMVQSMMERIWQEEGALYEETIEIPGRESRSRRRMKVPRRNYANAHGTVQDPRLFPYHSACYPLLDAYDALYPDGLGQPRHYANAVPPSIHEAVDESVRPTASTHRAMDPGEMPVPGFLGNSWNALEETFGYAGQGGELSEWRARRLSLNEAVDSARWLQVLAYQAEPDLWEREVFADITEILNLNNHRENDAAANGLDVEHHDVTSRNGNRKFGLRYFPERSDDRYKILLRLLKHALSELQRDHRLAEMVLDTIIMAHGCDRIDIFQYLLIVLQSEYLLQCDGECHARAQGYLADRHRHGQGTDDEDDEDETGLYPDHFCNDWFNFHSLIPLIISGGITYVTHAHANVLGAFVRRLYDAAGTPDPFVDPEPSPTSSNNPSDKQKLWLKRTLYYNRNTDYEDEDGDDMRPDDSGIPYELIRDLVLGLGAHAIMDNHTLQQLRARASNNISQSGQEHEPDWLKLIEQSAQSFYNCIKALVDIGEISIRRLPINTRSSEMCGCLVRALVMAMIPFQNNQQLDLSPERSYRRDSELHESIISPKRYANAITQATERFHQHKAIAKLLNEACLTHASPSERVQQAVKMVDAMLASQPPEDVRDLIRSLFARRMVDIRSSGCGYGDFLTWCRLPVDAYEPLLFYHYFNYPAAEDDEDEGEEHEERAYFWEQDENDRMLSKREHWARYDFTLLALQRVWNAPWTRESHHSFSPAFRTAVQGLMLCANRLGAPVDVAAYVSQFLHRDWFVDERMQCWHQDCLNQNARNLYWRKFQQRGCILSIRGPGKSKASSSLEYCPTCRVSMYCSLEHKLSDDKEGHKWCCGRPPWKVPLTAREEDLCLQVFALMESSQPDSTKVEATKQRHVEEVHRSDLKEGDEGDDDDDDDEGSWESIDSNDDNQGSNSLTAVISKFFEKKVYRHQGWE